MTKAKADEKVQTPASRRREHEAEVGASGALAGAAIGAIAGPPGAVAGAIIGGVVGALAAAALEDQSVEEAMRDAALDDTIGVTTDEIGAPNLEHPPAVAGACSAGTGGAGEGTTPAPADRPIQVPGS